MSTVSQQPTASESAQLARLDWYNAEITRYRDLQITITNFFAALYVALLYILLDDQKRQILQKYPLAITVAVLVHLVIGIGQFRYILIRLYELRKRRASTRLALGICEPEDLLQIPKEYRFEGVGRLFPWPRIVGITALAAMTLYLLWNTP